MKDYKTPSKKMEKKICEKAWITFLLPYHRILRSQNFFLVHIIMTTKRSLSFPLLVSFLGKLVVPHILYFRDWFNFVFYAYPIAFLSPFNHVKDLPVKAGITLWFRLCLRCCLFKGMLQQFCGVAAPSISSFFLSMTRNVISTSVHGHTTDFEWTY